MTRRSGDEYSPDEEHERVMPEPRLPDPSRHEGTDKPWWADQDKFSSAMSTATLIFIAAIVVILVLAGVIRLADWIIHA